MTDSENAWFNRVMIRSLACVAAVIWLAVLIQDGTWPLAFLSLAAVAVVLGILIGFRKVRSLRKVPDYAAIAAMEREIYGEAFRHDGAPTLQSAVEAASRLMDKRGPAAQAIGAGKEQAGAFETLMRSIRAAGAQMEAIEVARLGTEFRKLRPVRYAACPQGHPRWPWAEEYGQWCPVCHDKLVLSSSGVPGPAMGAAVDAAAIAELERSLKALDGWMDRL